jgi:NADH:ubiquinone oxidoreductase subunit C
VFVKFKLYFKYLLLNLNFLFLTTKESDDKNLILYTFTNNLYFISLHFKLSSLFYSTQLTDLFVYELPKSSESKSQHDYKSIISTSTNTFIVYNFHHIYFQTRIFIVLMDYLPTNSTLTSISELFLNANWLERENAEMHGCFFFGKKDIRNLLLPYGDHSAPMKKSFPSIGTREYYYDTITDLIIQNPVTLQF